MTVLNYLIHKREILKVFLIKIISQTYLRV